MFKNFTLRFTLIHRLLVYSIFFIFIILNILILTFIM